MKRSAPLAAVALLGCIACQPADIPEPRLVLLYATCSLNRHFLAPYDPAVSYTPNIDRLGKRSVVFTAHHTEAGQSGTSYASIFSGTQAMRHGVYDHPKKLPDSLFLIAEAFQAHGYAAYGFGTHYLASEHLNFMQGVRKDRHFYEFLTPKARAFRYVLDQLQENPDYKAFVVTNFTVTHYPYGHPTEDLDTQLREFCGPRPDECSIIRDREKFNFLRELYYTEHDGLLWDFDVTVAELGLSPEEVAKLVTTIELLYKLDVLRLDKLFGSVLQEIEARGLLDETLIAFTADHGEIMYRDHAFFFWTHGYQQAPEVIGVPLVMHIPGVEPRTYDAVTRSIDVFPTLLGLSGLPYPSDHVQGVDLSGEIRNGGERDGLLAFSHSDVLPHLIVEGGRLPATKNFGSLFPRRDPELMWVSVRAGNRFYKLRRLSDRGFSSFVFDLEEDPLESTNLFDPDDPEQQEMFERLEAYREQLLAGYAISERGGDNVPKDEQFRLLRSMGYIE